MAVKYAVRKLKKKDLKTGVKETKYYARAKYDGVTSQEHIAQMVAQISAISVGDVLSIMNTLSMLLSIELSNGRIVDLGDLGRFKTVLRSKLCDDPEKFKREMIRGNRILFTPGRQIRKKLTNPSYIKADLASGPSGNTGSTGGTTPGNPSTGGGSNTGGGGGNSGSEGQIGL